MAATPEGKIKKGVKQLLTAHGAYYHMPVVTGYGSPSIDFVGCHRGRFFGIETKAGDGKPTPRQEMTFEAIASAGGAAFVINEHTGLDALAAWLSATP